MSEVLYRKWRPQSFSEVSGQDAITRTLRNSVASGKLAHAYLFCGPRGTGKTSLGRLLAKAANCSAPAEGEPCNQCDSCLAFIEGRAMDFVEQDAASHNSVDDIRQLRENVVLTPMSGERKVYLLDEVHMLSTSAENALLKTLEEPPPHIIFVLATTDPQKVSATIISRCQRFDLRRIPLPETIQRLAQIAKAEGFTLDESSLAEIARSATGSLRDAVNSLEQVVTYYGPSPAYEQVQEALGLRLDERSGQVCRLALAGDLSGSLKLIAAVRDDGVEMRQFGRQMVRYLRGLLLVAAGVTEALDLPREMAAEVIEEAKKADRGRIIAALRAFGKADFRDDALSSLPLELALLDLIEQVQPEEPTASRPEPAAAPAPKPEPQFSIPVAEMDDIASTVANTTLEPTLEERREAETEPANVAGAPSGGLLERVREACRETDKQLSALLNGSCEVKPAEGDTIVLGFYHTFHLERLEKGSYAPRLEELFSAAVGRPVKLVLEHAPRSPREGAAGQRAPAKGGHLVQAARELGARPIPRPTTTEGGPNGEQ